MTALSSAPVVAPTLLPSRALPPHVMNAPPVRSSLTPPRLRGRAMRFVLRHLVVHLTLLVLAGVFFFPFVWMFGMSLKTDEESTSPSAFPALPSFRPASPYVRWPELPDRPSSLGRERWGLLQPLLIADASAAVAKVLAPPGLFETDLIAWRQAAAVEVTRRALEWVDLPLWANDGTDSQILRQFRDGIAHLDLPTVLQDCLPRFELGGLQVRSLSGHVKLVEQRGSLWKIVSGSARLMPVDHGSRQLLQYRFPDASAPPIVLRTEFDASLTADDLHRIMVAYRGDGSWHHLDAELQLGPRRYRSEQTTYIAQHRGASLLLQPPTFQDNTMGARNWVSLAPAGEGDAATRPTRAIVTLTLWPSSTARAVWGQFQRNYSRAFRSMPFWTYVGNSLVIVVLQLVGAVFSSGFVGFAFARLNWPGRSLAMGVLLATMMLPAQVTMIPSFLIWRSLGWYNTLNPLWIGAWFGNSFFIFLMIQHMRTIPRELDDAARIDGMNEFQTWWYVMMPQVKPALAAIAVLTFTGAWNEFMQPLILLRDQAKFPLGLGLFAMRIDANVDWPLIMSGNLLMVLPVVLIFFLFQRYFVEGVTVTGLKG